MKISKVKFLDLDNSMNTVTIKYFYSDNGNAEIGKSVGFTHHNDNTEGFFVIQ